MYGYVVMHVGFLFSSLGFGVIAELWSLINCKRSVCCHGVCSFGSWFSSVIGGSRSCFCSGWSLHARLQRQYSILWLFSWLVAIVLYFGVSQDFFEMACASDTMTRVFGCGGLDGSRYHAR